MRCERFAMRLHHTAQQRLPEVFLLAEKSVLSCLKKRDLLSSDKGEKAQLIEFGQRYVQQERLSDAIDFFERAEHVEGLIQLKEQCVAEGDYFLFLRLARILEYSPSVEEWVSLGDSAIKLNKLLFARSAYMEGEQKEKVAQVDKLRQFQAQEKAGDNDIVH